VRVACETPLSTLRRSVIDVPHAPHAPHAEHPRKTSPKHELLLSVVVSSTKNIDNYFPSAPDSVPPRDRAKSISILDNTTMSESYFARIVNEVLDASEKLTIRIEEGLNVVLSGGEEVPKTPGGTTPPPTTEHEFEDWDEDYADEESSPLAGMAESVMGDILSSQVRTLRGRS
jgi:hypothetical protein